MLDDTKVLYYIEKQLQFNEQQLNTNKHHSDSINRLCETMIKVLDELDRQNEEIRELQKIIREQK